jgi:heme-degrading monooxygenase HmoA
VPRAAQVDACDPVMKITELSPREAFEAWIKSPPFERSVARFSESSGWPGNYVEIDIDLAWCAWQDSAEYWNTKARQPATE